MSVGAQGGARVPSSGLYLLEEDQKGARGAKRLGLNLDKGHIQIQKEAYLGVINLRMPISHQLEDCGFQRV